MMLFAVRDINRHEHIALCEASDLDALVSLAGQLDSMNLPADRDFLAERISRSEHSFAGTLEDWREGVYVFVLVDTDAGRCIGTSTIIAKLGRHDAPYFWLAVTSEGTSEGETRTKSFAPTSSPASGWVCS